MAAVLFEGDERWHALMSIGAERLSDYDLLFPTREGAQSGAYLGIRIYVEFIHHAQLPPIHELEWLEERDADRWIEAHYAKPIWPP